MFIGVKRLSNERSCEVSTNAKPKCQLIRETLFLRQNDVRIRSVSPKCQLIREMSFLRKTDVRIRFVDSRFLEVTWQNGHFPVPPDRPFLLIEQREKILQSLFIPLAETE
jgi:hypothetical protein